jgi:hypothetical protein
MSLLSEKVATVLDFQDVSDRFPPWMLQPQFNKF